MKYEKLRNHRKRSRWVKGIFGNNPVLVGGLALPFAIMISNNLKNSVSASILLACSLIPTVLLAALIGSHLPKWFAVMLYSLFSMGLVVASIPFILPISPEVVDSLGIYVPIMAVNTVMLTLCRRYSRPNRRPIMALVNALTYSIGFAFAMCAIGFLRELFGNNTIWGMPTDLTFKISGLQIAFSGFILVAFLSAFFRFANRLVLCFLARDLHNHSEKPAAM